MDQIKPNAVEAKTSKDLVVKIGGISISGVKETNEDAFAARQPDLSERKYKGIVACIADGASFSAGAQLASQTSVTNFIEDYYSTPESWSVKDSAAGVLSSLNSWLFNSGKTGVRQDSLVTTFSGIILKSTTLHVFHVGDSRVYRLQNNRLQQLTTDHTHRHMGTQMFLTRALGIDSHLEVDYARFELQSGDQLILTTDGIHEFVADKDIRSILLSETDSLEDKSKQLTDLALDNGSEDNLSCLIVEVESLPELQVDEVHQQLTRLVIPPVMEPGMSIDGYTVLRLLHTGTRSHLYLVENSTGLDSDRSNEILVLKAPSINFEEDPLYLEYFIREEWVGRRLSHQNIRKVFARPPASPFLYQLCEYIEGQSLRQWMLDNPNPPIEKVRDIVASIVLALRAFQRKRMIHRDLKPENVLIDSSGTIKLIDFGTAQVSGLQEVTDTMVENIPLGSVNYTAPEYIKSGYAVQTSDLFSLGVIVYEMLSGHLPYKEQELTPDTVAKRDWIYKRLTSHRTDLPAWIDLALEKSVEPDPSKRQQAFSEFIQDLNVPNQELTRKFRAAPLIERNPTLFWQCVSASLLVLLIVSLIS